MKRNVHQQETKIKFFLIITKAQNDNRKNGLKSYDQ